MKSQHAKALQAYMQEEVRALLVYARAAGRLFSVVGWWMFFLGVTSIPGVDRYGCLLYAGFFLVPSWFLLRFADDLFPFNRKVFENDI